MSASQNGHTNVVEMLLQHGASVDLKCNVSVNILHLDPHYTMFVVNKLYNYKFQVEQVYLAF